MFPGAIRIVKNTVGGNGTFNFTAGPAPLANFQVTTVGRTGDHLFDSITNFQTYTVSEAAPPPPADFTFTSLADCTVVSPNGGTQTENQSTRTATIVLAEGEGVTCTYTNTLQPAALTVTKTADAASVSAGSPIGFTVTVHNGGTGTATGVTLTDALPGGSGTGVTWVKDPATGNPAAFTLAGAQGNQTLTLAGQPITLGAGATLSVHVTAQTSASECSTYNNTATVASTNDGGGSAPASIVCAGRPHGHQDRRRRQRQRGEPDRLHGHRSQRRHRHRHRGHPDRCAPGRLGHRRHLGQGRRRGNPAAFTLAGAQGSQTLTLAGQPISSRGRHVQRPRHRPDLGQRVFDLQQHGHGREHQ